MTTGPHVGVLLEVIRHCWHVACGMSSPEPQFWSHADVLPIGPRQEA